MQADQAVSGHASPRNRVPRPPLPGRGRRPPPTVWSRAQRRTVLAACAGSVVATALLLFAGG